jgi:hypothetical protein
MNCIDQEAKPPEMKFESFSAWLRSWRYFFGLLGLGLLIALFYAEENWRGERAWKKYKHQMEARGERLDALGFVPLPVPRSENFAMTPLLAPLFPFTPGSPQWSATNNALERAQRFAPDFDAAASAVKLPKGVRSNSWVTARTDLAIWHAAFLLRKGSTQPSPTHEPGPLTPSLSPSAPSAGKRVSARMGEGVIHGVEAQTNVPGTSLPFRPGEGDAIVHQQINQTPGQSGDAAAKALQEAAAGVLAGLSEGDPVIEEIRAASRRRYSRFEIHYEEDCPASILLPHLSVLRHFCQVLQLRASAELALERTEEAASDINLMLYLADACRDEPIMVSQWTRMAQLQLAIQPIAEGLGQWSEPQLRAFQERLQRFDFCANIKRGFAAERVLFGGGVIDYLRRNPDKYETLAGIEDGVNLPGFVWAAAPSGWFDFEKLNYSRVFDDCLMPGIDLASRRISPSASRHADERMTALLGKPWPTLFLRHRFFCRFLLPGFSGTLRKTAFAQTAADTTAIACALERHRLAHGHFPESLAELTPQSGTPAGGSRPTGFIDKLPRDIINGQPLQYRCTKDGQYVLYSVGWNETDDGGSIEVGKGVERGSRYAGPDAPQEGDWVWRPPARDR